MAGAGLSSEVGTASSEPWLCACRLPALGQTGVGQCARLPPGSFCLSLLLKGPYRPSYERVSKAAAGPRALLEQLHRLREATNGHAVQPEKHLEASTWEHKASLEPPVFCPPGIRRLWWLVSGNRANFIPARLVLKALVLAFSHLSAKVETGVLN